MTNTWAICHGETPIIKRYTQGVLVLCESGNLLVRMYRAEKVQEVGRAAVTRLSYLRINNSGSLAIFTAIPPCLVFREQLSRRSPARFMFRNNLFDQLVGAGEQRRRHSNAKRLGGFHIDD
jgi:hypothetical protein